MLHSPGHGELARLALAVAALVVPFVLAACSSKAADDRPAGAGGDGGEDASAFDGSFEVPLGPVATTTLTGCGGPGYAAAFTVGSQTFQLTIDTGSGTLAVASSTCATCNVSPEYTPGTTAVDDGKQTSDTYAAGSWQGEVYTDSVQLAGTSPALMIDLAAIDSQNAFFNGAGCGLGTVPFAPQGIAGFGRSDLSVSGTEAFLTKLTQGSAVPAVFAAEFCAQGGQLMLGGVDPVAGMLTGPAVYTPMSASSYYDIALDDLRFGDASLGYGAADFGAVTVDTGTSVLALPSAPFQALSSAIEGLSAFSTAFAGNTTWLGTTMCFTSSLSSDQIDAQLPALTLVVPQTGGGTIALRRKPTESYLPPTVSNGATYYCSGIYPSPVAGTILGTSAMLGQMVIVDLVGQRVGFAPQAYCP
jgi:hypothetical protein